MSNNLKLFIVAIISFLLGVMATVFFETKETSPSVNKSSNAPVTHTIIRKPFFLKVKESGQKVIQSFSQTPQEATPEEVTHIDSQSTYLKLTEKLEKFRDDIYNELRKKYRVIPFSKTPEDVKHANHLTSTLQSMFEEKRLWYKSSFEDELTQTKMVLFFKFYSCNSTPKPGMKLSDICYRMQLFNFRDKMWYQTNISSQVVGLLWNNDVAYAHIELNGVGNFSKETNAFYAVVPVPDEQLPMQYLKYDAGKPVWQTGSEVRWSASSENEIAKFETMTQSISSQMDEREDP